MAVVELKNITRVFGLGESENIALGDVSLAINPGEFVAIMGPSGSGKTSLLNIIGLLDRPNLGNYKLLGEDVGRVSTLRRANIRRLNIGFVFQAFNLIPKMTVVENVALPLTYSGASRKNRLKYATDMLERLDMRKYGYLLPYQLSAGQTQRVAIARALINKPNLIVADEPTGNLDSVSGKAIMEILSSINQQGNTILMVTHNPELTSYANRIVYMHDGKVYIDRSLAANQQVDLGKMQNVVHRASRQQQESVSHTDDQLSQQEKSE